MSSNIAKRMIINAYKKRLDKELKSKFAKKGLLIKVFESNKKRSDSLVEILKESDDLNHMSNNSSSSSSSSSSRVKTDDEYLKKFHNVPKGGPKHSIAVKRAHHLTNFLSEYIINAFQSAHFESPEIPEDLNTQSDLNGFKKEKFSFEISNVELLSDLSALKISWLASENENINQIVEVFLEKRLKSQIRNILINERVISYVPKVVFVRDETKVLINKLDEYLMKINLETKEAPQEEEEEVKQDDVISTNIVKKKEINNLYGVDFNTLIESIKTGTSADYKLINPKTQDLTVVNNEGQSHPITFETSLKAFEINKRLGRERLNKSALLKLSQIEFEEFRNKNFS